MMKAYKLRDIADFPLIFKNIFGNLKFTKIQKVLQITDKF